MGKNGIMQRFRGSYDVKIDDRGRVKIPAKFLQVFDSGYGREIFITSLNGDHVMMYPIKVWESMEKKIESVGIWNPDINDFVSRLYLIVSSLLLRVPRLVPHLFVVKPFFQHQL